jgi:hypothetical protein
MTAGAESAAADDFLYGLLTADGTLTGLVGGRVFNTEAPQPAQYPLVVFQFMSGIDMAAVGAFRIWTNMMYLVKVVGQTMVYSDLGAAVARIDQLLHRTSGTVADGTVWTCTREQVIRVPESISGKPFRHAGGLYRVCAS